MKKGKPRFNRSKPEDRTAEGYVFDSKVEMQRYEVLRARQKGKRLSHLCIHPVFILAGVFYEADFFYLEKTATTWVPVVEEVKPLLEGKRRARFRQEALRAWRRNAAQMWEIHGIEVVLVEA